MRLEVKGLKKRYGDTRALDGLDITADAGEVLGIAGPNGAGKSTLVRLLAAEEEEDEGGIFLGGKRWSTHERRQQVAVVHQESKLFPTLTVTENLLVGVARSKLLRPAPTSAEADLLREFGLSSSAGKPLESCSLVVHQLVEIARAMLRDARAFLFDEPNSALTSEESKRLFQHIQRLREESSCIVVLISHRLDDLVSHCDRVVVVRDGRVFLELKGGELTTSALGQAIIGASSDPGALDPGSARGVEARARGRSSDNHPDHRADALLRVSGWSDRAGSAFRGVDFAVHTGEALLITGQEGSGGREIVQSLGGVRVAGGIVEFGGLGTTGEEREEVVCYLPADRRAGLFENFSVAANLASRLGRGTIASRAGHLRRSRIMRIGEGLIERLRIRARSPLQPIATLSGGNQQKVSVGSALAAAPSILLVEEPTRGVDVGTKEEIYSALHAYLAEGNALVAFSPELDEVFRLATTVCVSVDGRLSPPVSRGSFGRLEELADWVDGVTSTARVAPEFR